MVRLNNFTLTILIVLVPFLDVFLSIFYLFSFYCLFFLCSCAVSVIDLRAVVSAH
jgi:hypothetical protein